MTIQRFFFCMVLGLFLAGCASIEKERHVSVGKNPEYGSYLLAQDRLNRVRPGMSRGDFLELMQLRRLPAKEWYRSFSGGDGWLVALSRMNKLPDGDLIEEYSFGYHEGRRVVERDLVILRNGKVSSILEMPKPKTRSHLPRALLAEKLSREEENRMIQSYVTKVHLSGEAFVRAEAALEIVRVGMTAGELRYYLGGYFYRLSHGYVYFADGFMWGPEFQSFETPTGNLALMPFGYITDGKEVKRYLIKIVDGVITEIIKTPKKPDGLTEGNSG